MSINHIHHINYLVADMAQAISLFDKLFQLTPVMEELVGRNVMTARYELSGTYLVLVQPLTDVGTVADILRERGEGVFLISFSVNDLSEAIKALETQSVEVSETSLREGLDNWKVCDLASNSLQNIVLQLCQANAKN